MRVAREGGEWTLEMVIRAGEESETIRKVCDGEEGRDRMASKHWTMARSSTVKIDAELR